jgi:Protein of unknown function (DUF1077)
MTLASGVYQPLMAIIKSGDGMMLAGCLFTATLWSLLTFRAPANCLLQLTVFFELPTVFKQDEDNMLDVLTPRAIYCGIHLLGLLFALYKLNNMGLLPTHPSDFISAMIAPHAAEFSGGGTIT